MLFECFFFYVLSVKNIMGYSIIQFNILQNLKTYSVI